MNRPIARCLAATIAILLAPASALATPEVGEHDNGWSITDETYLRTYERCWEALKADCGRNVVDDGMANGVPPPEARVEESTETMKRWLSPPEPEPVTAAVAETGYSAAPASVATSGAGCTGMEAESGSAGYSAVSPTGQYIGCYQIDQGLHYGTGGVCEGLGTDPAGQDACAANICSTSGAGAWTNAAGANPC